MASPVDKFAELPDDTFERMQSLMRAMDIFREYDTAFPMSYAVAFLLVALKPGRALSEYARDMGALQPVTSRLMLEIGIKSRHGGEGLGLIDSVPDPKDLRSRRLYVTPKGRALLKRLDNAMGAKVR